MSTTTFRGSTSPSQHEATCHQQNVGQVERWGSMLAGGLMVLNGIERGSLPGLILTGLGAALLYRGFTGHCHLYDALGYSSRTVGNDRGVPAQAGFKYERTIVINRPAHELYAYWRNFENLPRIMRHLKSVTELSDNRSHWVAEGPMGISVAWDAEILNEDPGRMIAWESLPGSAVDTAGSVHFDEKEGRGSEVRVSLKYNPPGGKLGAGIAWLMGQGAEKQIEEDLRKFKQFMETGEAATFSGPSSRRQF